VFRYAVVLPTYNRKELLLRAIMSVKTQTYEKWRLYIVDDHSDEDILGYLQEHNILSDERISYTRQDANLGVNRARNRALDMISNSEDIDYITFLDDDDYLLPYYLEKASNILKKNPTDWLVTACVTDNMSPITIINKEGEVEYLEYLLGKSMQGDAAMMIKKSLLYDIRFTLTYKNGQEWALFLQLSTKTKMYVYDIPSIVKEYLVANDLDGLGCDCCCCDIEDLMPCCNEGVEYCYAGYYVPCDPET